MPVKRKLLPKRDGGTKETGKVPGMVPGGIPIVVLTSHGRRIEVSELSLATVESLKQRIYEAGRIPTDTMCLFIQVTSDKGNEPGVRRVEDIIGYKYVNMPNFITF